MKNRRPPFLPSWLLEHVVSRTGNEALSGDLLEEFWNGRTATWFSRQVVFALVHNFIKGFRTRWMLLAFAVVLTGLVRASWWFNSLWPVVKSPAFLHPWPGWFPLAICSSVLLSLWIGLIFYSGFCFLAKRELRIEMFERGLWLGPLVFLLSYGAIQGVTLPQSVVGNSLGGAKLAIYFLSLMIAAWDISPTADCA